MTNQSAANEFTKLLELADLLFGPEGCAWDREQTLSSLRHCLLEETSEAIEAIDENDTDHIIEELGDLFYLLVFLCKIGEKENRFCLSEMMKRVREKLIGRHPHVFGENKLNDSAAVLEQWEKIKQEEKNHRKSALDGIPKGLPALARGYKVAHKMAKKNFKHQIDSSLFTSEEELAALLWAVVKSAEKKKIHPELILKKEVLRREKEFREWEQVI